MNEDDLKQVPQEEETINVNPDIAADEAPQVDEADSQETPDVSSTEESAAEEPATEESAAEEPATEESATEDTATDGASQVEEPVVEEKQPTEAEIYRDRLVRLQADFDNYRKRMVRDKADMIKSANADLLSAMLPALDHIDHALASLEKNVAPADASDEATKAEPNPYIEGFKLIQNELLRGLEKFGLKPIDSIGKPFDVEVHEALSKMPSDSVPPEHVLFEVRKGYTLNGKVLRAAQVIVSAAEE